ncbi:MAG: cytochrome B [Novosphingobium sp. 28-62-57]|uniref:YceI family protein n=1 Tax=unclassified Novosphingobium TaxID=2644732 RepID=UPI000BCDB9FC|nr:MULTISPECIES: YceI family protein [unclassified Novosphingobium]OYW48993.1 MAG: cytochrome B [Novosphingobium sp. 12-62-10]OYZ09540.1 MAG: cytochrome B [Novosphingobium sp. 28-62-57]OZA37859.1 MAG: cytochrome B [Novosphingobium sp. 17-62-9]HQS70177.1 YceI family protein [Novosphingobium sp.]
MTAISPSRYASAAIALHWILAILLLFQVGLGGGLEHLPKGVAQFAGYQFHKSVGITILLLSVLRLGVRLARPRPAPVPDGKVQMLAARAVHVLLYAIMIGGPITGWVIVSTAKVRLQTMLFGVVPWPDLPVGQALHEPAEVLHGLLGPMTLALVLLHVAGALYHHFKREDVIGRMLPKAIASRSGISMAAALAVVAGFAALVSGRGMTFAAPVAAPVTEASTATAFEDPLPEASASAPEASASAEEPAPAASEEAATTAKASPWALEKGGRLGFTADYSGDAIEGSFGRWDAKIVFDPQDLAGSSIRATIDLASVESGDSQRDYMLKSDSFFGVAIHPTAQFVSTAIREAGPDRYVANGTLSLHGKSRPVALRFSLKITGDTATANGSASLQRLAFGVGEAEWSATDQLKDAVGIDFSFRARRK